MAPAYKSRGGPSGSSSAGRPKGKFSMRANQNPVGGPARGPAARATGAERAGSKQQPQQQAGAAKRKRPTAPRRDEPDSDDDDEEDSEGGDEEGDVEAGESEVDTDGEIEKTTKSKKTQKRKRRAVSPTSFGATLQDLLGGPAPSGSLADADAQSDTEAAPVATSSKPAPGGPILSMAPHLRKAAQATKLSAKASRLATEARKEREERARVKDVIAGWGAPGCPPGEGPPGQAGIKWEEEGGATGREKRLRKVAQRGVVKLFNAIRAAQNTSEADLEEDGRGAGAMADSARSSEKGRNELGGKGKAVAELSKSNFLDLIRAGRAPGLAAGAP